MKVVFLIDSGLVAGEKNTFNEILIVALRLLSFFSSRDGLPFRDKDVSKSPQKNAKNVDYSTKKHILEWGFKFFSSHGSAVRAKLSKKTTSFSKTIYESFHCFQKNAKLAFDIEKESTHKRKSFTHPSEQLTTALTEILHDFEWQDRSDNLKSPSRLSRKRIKIQYEDNLSVSEANIVFIFSKAPSSKSVLRRFSNKVVIDSDVFIDSLMSPALLKEYTENLRININWIDFNCDENVPLNAVTTNESLKIVKESMKKLGGDLLLKSDILRDHNCNSISSYFKEAHPPVWCSIEASVLDRLSPGQQIVSSPDIYSSIFVSGSYKLELAGAKLTTFADKNGDFVSCSKSNNENSTSTSKQCGSVTGFEGTDSFLSDRAEIELQGCISASAAAGMMIHLNIHQSTMLTCDSQSKLCILLRLLIRTQNLGILKIAQNNKENNSCLAVLSPLTSLCGHIFFLSWNQQVDMEKACLFEINHTGNRSFGSKDISQSSKCHHEEIKQENENSQTSANFSKPVGGHCQFDSHVLNSWHMPGSTQQLAPLICRLKDRAKNHLVPSSSVKEVMASLKKLYMKAKEQQPVIVTDTPKTEPPVVKIGDSGESDSSLVSARRLSRRSSSSLSRGRLMVDKARSASMSVAGEDESSNQSAKPASPGSRRTSGSGFENLNVKSEEELVAYLYKQYSQVVSAGIAMEASIQAMVTVTCYFMSTQDSANPQKAAVAFIRKHLALDLTKLKEKYGKKEDVDRKSEATEYKLQVILLLEMASFVIDNEDVQGDRLVTALVSMLRVLSFIIGPVSLREFMATTADSYCSTLTKVLMDVFDELDLPYPPSLAKLASPSAPSTVWGANASVGSVDSFVSGPGSQPPSSSQQLSQGTRRSRLKQHPSLSDFRQKKQILVEKPASKPVSKSEGRKSVKDKGKQRVKITKNRHGVDYGRAKRNLFSDKSKAIHASKGKDKLQLTPKRKSGKAKLLVPGTPAHKQTSERMLSRQKRLRDHLNIKPDVQVVAESPLKDEDPLARVDNKPARFILRESFYSSNLRQSRIVAKSMEMAERGESQPACTKRFLQLSRSHGSLISAVRGESPILSPKTNMLRSFLASPSSGIKSDGSKISTTPPSHFLRRSPRKSVKKLLFHGTDQDQIKDGSRGKTQNSLDAQLVFDGENASDALPCRSPLKNQKVHREGFKTPEKRKHPQMAEWWESASCPPLQVTPTKVKERKQVKTPELNFKNFFSTTSSLIGAESQSSSHKYLEAKCFSQSPAKRESMYKGTGKPCSVNFTGAKDGMSKSSRSSKGSCRAQLQRSSPLKGRKVTIQSTSSVGFSTEKKFVLAESCASNSNRIDASEISDGDIVLSTPKKPSHSRNITSIHSTPSKVTFSDSCLISPPTGSGYPFSTTPQKSILKASPAAKRPSFINRIELASSSTAPTTCNINSASQSLCYDRKITHESPLKRFGGHSTESLPKRPRTPNFDSDSSSSNSSHLKDTRLPGERPSVSTVVTVHTPSPSNKCKTPEGINKWMRRKRHSGSKTISGSSSSSSVSSSSSSNENEIGDRAAHQPNDGGESMANVHPDITSQSEGEHLLKRNLFSVESEASALGSPPHKKSKDISNQLKTALSSKSHEMVKIVGERKDIKMASHISGGFSHNPGLIHYQDKSFNLQKRPTLEAASTSTAVQDLRQFTFSPNRSPAKSFRLTRQNSSFLGEGSHGFEVESDSQRANEIFPSTTSKFQNDINMTESPSLTKSASDSLRSPRDSKSGSTPVKKQFSPALSTSGLLQLIRSPLLEEQERRSRKKRARSKSRKHLDWP